VLGRVSTFPRPSSRPKGTSEPGDTARLVQGKR
jgi:hypothetical protein